MLYCGKTDIGRKRSVNQDSFLCESFDNGMLLAVVCDGMGGAAGGGTASSLAAEAFIGFMKKVITSFKVRDEITASDEKKIKDAMLDAVDSANKAVYKKAMENDSLRGMGTTLVGTLVFGDVMFCVNVGDSRLYLITDKTIKQITHDHSYVQYLVDVGRMTAEEAKKSINRNIITRAVGTDKVVETDVFITYLRAKGITQRIESEAEQDVVKHVVLLCTDGLTNHVSPQEIEKILGGAEGLKTERALMKRAEILIDKANESGGTDNITTVLLTI